MFYIANILLSMGLQRLSEFTENFLAFQNYSYYGASYETSTLWLGLLLSAIGALIIIKRWNRHHSHNIVGRIIGILLMIACLNGLINSQVNLGDMVISSIPARVLAILSYLIPGVLIFLYNKKITQTNKLITTTESSQNSHSEPLEEINSETEIDRLRAKLLEASKTPYAQKDIKFYNNLAHSSDILDEIQIKSFSIKSDFLEQIARLTDYYLDIEDNKFQTKQSQETLQKIVDTFNTIDEALENIYDSNFTQESFEIESDIISMKAKLNMEGELDSPFEKITSKAEENYRPE